jgi:hypothetical protein
MKWPDFGNAFKMPAQEEITPEEEALLVALAGKIKQRKMELPASLAIESTKPLHSLGAQASHFLAPIMDFLATPQQQEMYRRMLTKQKAVTRLLQLLEEEQKNSSGSRTGEENGKKTA